MADWNLLKKEFTEQANKKISWMNSEFQKVRTGRANPTIFYDLKVDSYGTKTPLNQLANISSPEPRKISIKPYDTSLIKAIVTEINNIFIWIQNMHLSGFIVLNFFIKIFNFAVNPSDIFV